MATALMFTGITAGHISGLQRAFGPQGTRHDKLVHSLRLPLKIPLVLLAWKLHRK